MKYLRELTIVIAIYLFSDFISSSLNLALPGNILGMLLLLLMLITGIIKVTEVENIANFFLNHLSFFFSPAGVGLISSMETLKSSFIEIVIICITTTIFILIITGKTVEFIQKLMTKGGKSNDRNN